MEPKKCQFQRVVVLPDQMYRQFQLNMLAEYDFISQYRDEMHADENVVHCILVMGQHSDDGILVNSEGYNYARYTAYFPAARCFLNEQEMEQEESQHREVSQEELAQAHVKHALWMRGFGGEKANFSDCLLSELDMRGMCFHGAVFRNAMFDQTSMQSAGLSSCDFHGAQFLNCGMDNICAEDCDLTECSICGCSMRGTSLERSNLSNAKIKDTSLWSARMQDSCIDCLEVSEEALAEADTRNTSINEARWLREHEEDMQMGGMSL